MKQANFVIFTFKIRLYKLVDLTLLFLFIIERLTQFIRL